MPSKCLGSPLGCFLRPHSSASADITELIQKTRNRNGFWFFLEESCHQPFSSLSHLHPVFQALFWMTGMIV